jgi:hypothetical protein
MAVRDDPSALLFDYADNDANAIFPGTDPLDEHLVNLSIRRENGRTLILRWLSTGKGCR